MQVEIHPSSISGQVKAPASKSYTHRAMLVASLSNGQSQIANILLSDDTNITLRALRKLGVSIIRKKDLLIINGNRGVFNNKATMLKLGLSGTSARLLMGIAALGSPPVIIDGDPALRTRPMKDLCLALRQLGATVLSNNDSLPLTIYGGRLTGGKVTISGSISSQYVSSLLIIAPFLEKGLTIKIKGLLNSAPYVDITKAVMKSFGVRVISKNHQWFKVLPGQKYLATAYTVEGDYSSASYFFAAAAILKSEITVTGLTGKSIQADKQMLIILKQMGCQIQLGSNSVMVKGKLLQGITVDMSKCPDIVQTVCVVASYAQGETRILNIGHLKHKETNRINATVCELNKAGIFAACDNNSITIKGGKPKGCLFETYNDHRMAMSFSILGLKAIGVTTISKAEIVSKSYPDFFTDLKNLGAIIKEIS